MTTPTDDTPDPFVALQANGEQLDAQMRWVVDRVTSYATVLREQAVAEAANAGLADPHPHLLDHGLRTMLVTAYHEALLRSLLPPAMPALPANLIG